MGTSWVARSIKNVNLELAEKCRHEKNIKIVDFNGMNVDRHWHVCITLLSQKYAPIKNIKYVSINKSPLIIYASAPCITRTYTTSIMFMISSIHSRHKLETE